MGELGYMALEEYDPGAAFPGVIGRAADEPGPAWPTRRRCLRRVPGVGMRWMRGYGRWVREILVWTKAPFLFSLAGEGLCVGRDSAEPVTGDYPGAHPHTFTGGTIKRVAVDVSGDPYLNLEREAQAMLARE
jgi:hypothetical protein